MSIYSSIFNEIFHYDNHDNNIASGNLLINTQKSCDLKLHVGHHTDIV